MSELIAKSKIDPETIGNIKRNEVGLGQVLQILLYNPEDKDRTISLDSPRDYLNTIDLLVMLAGHGDLSLEDLDVIEKLCLKESLYFPKGTPMEAALFQGYRQIQSFSDGVRIGKEIGKQETIAAINNSLRSHK